MALSNAIIKNNDDAASQIGNLSGNGINIQGTLEDQGQVVRVTGSEKWWIEGDKD